MANEVTAPSSMADPTLFHAPAPVQLPAIPGRKAKTKKVIVVRRTTRPSENGESTSSSVPTLPVIKQRESWNERAYSTSPISEQRDSTPESTAQQATSSRADLGPLPFLGASVDQMPVGDSSQSSTETDAGKDANPDEFGALILANIAREEQNALAESSSQLDGAAQPANECSGLTSGLDVQEEYPAEIVDAIKASEDGGAAIKEAYERRRQHRRELTMQVSGTSYVTHAANLKRSMAIQAILGCRRSHQLRCKVSACKRIYILRNC